MLEFRRLMAAYLECRRHKRNSAAALAFEIDLENNLLKLYRELCNGSYRISPCITFVVERPVYREVFAADFRDRIVHHLLMTLLIPHMESEFIYDSYACRPGRGTLFGVRRIRRFLAQCSEGDTKDCYVFKGDISGFFMHIDRMLLWRMLREFILKIDFGDRAPDPQQKADLFSEPQYSSYLSQLILQLTKQIVLHDPVCGCHINGSVKRWDHLPPDKSLFSVNGLRMPHEKRPCVSGAVRPLGIPIGNLTSQWFGNFYLNKLDHFIKHTLGVRYYGRYVDDFVIVHPDKERLKSLIPRIERFLLEELGLQLHPRKRYLQHYSKGVVFLGAAIRRGALLTGSRMKAGACNMLYKWNKLSEERLLSGLELSRFRDSLNSYWGLMKHHNSYKLRRKMAGAFATQIASRTRCCNGYCKIVIRDYIPLSRGKMIPYVEWWRLFDAQDEEKLLK